MKGQFISPPIQDNQKSITTQYIGPVAVTITYNSPNVTSPTGKDRTDHIWGELVPYGMVNNPLKVWTLAAESPKMPWRTGANENTTISFSHDVIIEGKPITAGTYAIFLIVEQNDPWTLILSKDVNNWGSFFYNEKNDALRVPLKLMEVPFTEWLNFGFDNRFLTYTTAYMEWEKKRVEFKIEVPNVHELYLSRWRDEMKSKKALDVDGWMAAVDFCLANDMKNWEEALAWCENGLFWAKNYKTLSSKAKVLEKLGRQAEADEQWKVALEHRNTTLDDLLSYAGSWVSKNDPAKAKPVYTSAFSRYPKEAAYINLRMARAYRLKDKKISIEHYETAIKNWPKKDADQLPRIKEELDKVLKS
jgi:hypothetical protein